MFDPLPSLLADAHPNLPAGSKRRAPALLPAFEPISSPPRFKRQKSRPTPADLDIENQLPSSPPCLPAPRPLLQRTQSTVSERAPLSAVPSITLPESGQPILLGRSSKSSHYTLSANSLISRVHVRAVYKKDDGKVEIECLGWNGVKVHCQGHVWELMKGDVFTSETEMAEVMLDVQDSRVLLAWPGVPRSASTLVGESPRVRVERSRSPSLGWEIRDENAPPKRKFTPVSPTPRRNTMPSESMMTDTLRIYEDSASESEDDVDLPESKKENAPIFSFSENTDGVLTLPPIHKDSGFESDLILPSMARFSTPALPSSPRRLTRGPSLAPPSRASSTRASFSHPSSPPPSLPTEPLLTPTKLHTLSNHLTNQLAFSRVATVPLSELHERLPSSLAPLINKNRLHDILSDIPCIGEVKRHGKDAAGKPLESQFYYLPDEDRDEGRRTAVAGRAGVRSCRKTHKQYYWKKPKKTV